MQKNQKKKQRRLIEKPFIQGEITDSLTLKRGLSVFGVLAVSMLLYLLLGAMLTADSIWLRVLFSFLSVGVFVALSYSNGVSAGFQDVTFAEIAYQREKENKEVDAADKKKCFHPLKGLISGLIGASPFIFLALILAITAQPQLYQASPLPSWLATLERNENVGNALKFYQEINVTLGFVDIVRILVRLLVMPFITLVGTENIYALCMVERLSPLIMLLIPFGYGAGYFMGKRARARVHGDIAANRKKQKRKEKKRIEQKRKEPEQLV